MVESSDDQHAVSTVADQKFAPHKRQVLITQQYSLGPSHIQVSDYAPLPSFGKIFNASIKP